MADKGRSFRPYRKTEKQNFENEGLLLFLDYPMFNDMINGLLLKSFEEKFKAERITGISYNPQNNKFLSNFKIEVFNSMISDRIACVCLTNLRLQEVIEHVQIMLACMATKWPDMQERLSQISQKLRQVDNEVDSLRRDLNRSAPRERRESINSLFQEKKNQLLGEVKRNIGARYVIPDDSWLSGPISQPLRDDQSSLDITKGRPSALDQSVDRLIGTSKPSGEDFPLDMDYSLISSLILTKRKASTMMLTEFET